MRMVKAVLTLSLFSVILAACKKESEAPPNTPPVVITGPDTTIYLSNAGTDSFYLNGSATDKEGTVVEYDWSQLSGPNTVVFKTPGLATTFISGIVTGTYVFQLTATDDKGATGVKSLQIDVLPPPLTLTLQPAQNPDEGYIDSINPFAFINTTSEELPIASWHKNGTEQDIRGLLKFDLSGLPSGARLVSAKLSLYSNPTPLGGNGVDANYGTGNALSIERVASDWNTTISYAGQPLVDALTSVVVPHTDKPQLDLIDIDVTAMVKDMVQMLNYGFLLRIQHRISPNSRIFCSSKHPDTTKHPKLVLQYVQ